MTGNPEEDKSDNPLRLKKNATADGKSCPSCGASMPDGAVVCVHCGFDKRTGRHTSMASHSPARIPSRRPVSRGLFTTLAVFVCWIVLLAGLAFGLFKGYGYYRTQNGGHPDSAIGRIITGDRSCPTCRGQGKVKCAACGGFGSVDQMIQVKCKQCAGSGKYVMMNKRQVDCPFCKGKGFAEIMGRANCTVCDGHGWTLCDRCGGDGKL